MVAFIFISFNFFTFPKISNMLIIYFIFRRLYNIHLALTLWKDVSLSITGQKIYKGIIIIFHI